MDKVWDASEFNGLRFFVKDSERVVSGGVGVNPGLPGAPGCAPYG